MARAVSTSAGIFTLCSGAVQLYQASNGTSFKGSAFYFVPMRHRRIGEVLTTIMGPLKAPDGREVRTFPIEQIVQIAKALRAHTSALSLDMMVMHLVYAITSDDIEAIHLANQLMEKLG